LERLKVVLNNGLFASSIFNDLNDDDFCILKTFNLITAKKVLYVCNVDESGILSQNEHSSKVKKFAKDNNCEAVVISVKIENEISQIQDSEEREFFLKELGLEQSGLESLAAMAFKTLNLITFFTIGPKEAHAWTLKNGNTAPQAAGVIHSDFEKGFIRAETISYDDYIKHGSELSCKENGRLRLEGSDYIVKDGDIFHFRFNV
jgi:ribosome-binding ATPase YchF (GTP1/OBG family)